MTLTGPETIAAVREMQEDTCLAFSTGKGRSKTAKGAAVSALAQLGSE